MIASIELAVEGRGEIAERGPIRRGRGEKKPAALIELGPPDSRSRGLLRGGALGDGVRWLTQKGGHRFEALAIWVPDKTLAKTCADFRGPPNWSGWLSLSAQ
jgi:hypothetical protein